MINNRLNFKTIILSGLCALTIMSGCLITQTSCRADEVTLTPYFEKITKQYPSMEEYVIQTRSKIKDNWYPSSKAFEKSATLVLTLNKDGRLLNTYISNTSGDESFDNSLIVAAQKTKFSPLPSEVQEESVSIDMQFNMQRRSIFNKNTIQLPEKE